MALDGSSTAGPHPYTDFYHDFSLIGARLGSNVL